MKCKKCGYEKGSEYFKVKHPQSKKTFLLCAKCYCEKFLELQPYFCNTFLNSKSKIPLRHHYMSANLIRFLMHSRTFISSFIKVHHEGRLPVAIKFNTKKLERQLQHIHGIQIKKIKNAYYLTKLILLLKEAYTSLELSVRLALNNHDRSAVSELRFIFEKYIDFSYLLLPLCSSLKKNNEIDFSDWIAGCEFKSTMKQRCECFNDLLNKPYNLYRLLCKASHGSRIFLHTTHLIFSNFEDLFDFFRYLRWFDLYLWVLEVIYSVQELFKKELNITNDEFDKLQNEHSKILDKCKGCLTEVKENRFYEVEFTKYKVKYWLNFEGLLLNNWKDNFSAKIRKKLINDYIFLFSSANYKFD